MRVALLAPANSIHTIRWANGLVSRGLEVHLLSAHPSIAGLDAGIHVHRLALPALWAYLFGGRDLASRLQRLKPDLLNVHYATGYGRLARMSDFQPTLLSVWGSDVYDFPAKSGWHRRLLKRNLAHANALASTSECMAEQVRRFAPGKQVFVTPFGVDITVFQPGPARADGAELVIGTVKTLEHKYGVDQLIRAFALLLRSIRAPMRLRLDIAGGGSQLGALQALAGQLGIAKQVRFLGRVEHAQVPGLLQGFDIFAALSRLDSESFGVAAVEAAACGKPVVVSDVAGLAEVTRHLATGFVVPREDPQAAARAMATLVEDALLRRQMGEAGRAQVLERYSWERSLDLMLQAYQSVVGRANQT